MKKKELRFEIKHEGGWYTASCLDTFIVTQAKTFKSLEKNINEAVEAHLEGKMGPKPAISVIYNLPAHA